MKIIYTAVFTISILILLVSCQDNSKQTAASSQQETTSTTEEHTTTQANQGEKLYQSVPLDTLMMLFQQCDYIDYVFYYTNFSVSQSNQPDIQQSLRYISENPPFIKDECKPQGHIFFQVNGDNRLEADLYFQAGCTYYVFYKDGKPAYANELMPSGIQFYNNIFQSVKQ